jgi:hypothetical protein
MIIMTARASSDHDLSRCSRRAPSGTVLAVLLLCLAALAGCGASGEPPVQRVAYCQGPMSDHPSGDLVEVQFRQGTTVVARGTVPVGAAVTAEVPVGAVQIDVDGVQVGAVNEGVPTDGPHDSPGPGDLTYIARGEGCPDSADL